MLESHKTVAILCCVIVFVTSYSDALSRPASLTRAGCSPIWLKNGRSRYRQKSGFVQNVCSKGFILVGDKYMKCTNGRWEGITPMCVRNTCKTIKEPVNGFIYNSHRGGVMNFFCKHGYELIGPPTAFCDGDSWSTHLPVCKDSNKTISLNCDFELEDICGWTHDLSHNFDWTRHNKRTPSSFVATGPSYDHTLGAGKEGYYMYIEASSKNPSDTARLISPVHIAQDNNTCLEFWYHMYGATMGELRVYLHKISNPDWNFVADQAVFTVSGNHGNRWLRGFIELGIIDDDFQVVFEAVRGGNYMSDTAIDDVKVIENCVVSESEPTEDTTSTDMSSTDDGLDYLHKWSCQNRCGIETIVEFCSCTTTCYGMQNCCPDYEAYCLDVDTEIPSTDMTLWPSVEETSTPSTITEEEETKPQELPPTVEYQPIAIDTMVSEESLIFSTPTTRFTAVQTAPTTNKATRKPASTTTVRTTTKVVLPILKPTKKVVNVKIPKTNVTTIEKKQKAQENEILVTIGDKDKLSKQASVEEKSGISMTLLLVSAFAGTLVIGVVVMVKLRRRCVCPVRMTRGQSSDSQSDVRFLTSDEILDFTLASTTL